MKRKQEISSPLGPSSKRHGVCLHRPLGRLRPEVRADVGIRPYGSFYGSFFGLFAPGCGIARGERKLIIADPYGNAGSDLIRRYSVSKKLKQVKTERTGI